MANSAAFPFNELRFPGNEQQQQGRRRRRRRRRHNELDPFKIGAKLSAAQFLSASFRGRSSYWLFEAIIPIRVRFLQRRRRRRTFASIRSVLRRRKEGRKMGQREDFSPRNWGAAAAEAITGGHIVAAIEFSCPFDSDSADHAPWRHARGAAL